jgi:hypothetical protein
MYRAGMHASESHQPRISDNERHNSTIVNCIQTVTKKKSISLSRHFHTSITFLKHGRPLHANRLVFILSDVGASVRKRQAGGGGVSIVHHPCTGEWHFRIAQAYEVSKGSHTRSHSSGLPPNKPNHTHFSISHPICHLQTAESMQHSPE